MQKGETFSVEGEGEMRKKEEGEEEGERGEGEHVGAGVLHRSVVVV